MATRPGGSTDHAKPSDVGQLWGAGSGTVADGSLGFMRVVAGTVGGRRLLVPQGPAATIRPTSELVRGALFNSLGSLGVVDGAVIVDLFAGSGALGIEALSRGARRAVFVDRDRRATAVIRSNLDALGLASRATVVQRDVQAWLADGTRADLVVADPPYRFNGWVELLGAVRTGLVAAESDRPLEPPPAWDVLRSLRHGGTVVTLLAPQGVLPA